MKKKVLALVVLAAMLVSVLPFAAFAADPGPADSFYSAVKEETTSAAADGYVIDEDNDYLEYKVNLRDTNWSASAPSNLFIATSRPTVDKIYIEGKGENGLLTVSEGYVKVENLTGEVTVRIYSGVAGTSKIVFATSSKEIGADVAAYAQGQEGSSAAAACAIGEKTYTGTFTSASVDKLVLVSAVPSNGEGNTPLANGSQRYTITVALKAANNAPVAGKEVTFSATPSGIRFSETKVTTDSNGEAEVKVYATKADTYKVIAKADDVDDLEIENKIKFKAAGIDTIKAESSNNKKVAQKEAVTFEYSFYDANGNQFPIDENPVFDKAVVKTGDLEDAELALVSAPSGAKFDPENTSHFTAKCNDDNNLEIKINKNMLDKEGDYSLKLTLANGKSVTYDFSVKKQGDITSMTFTYKSDSIPAIKGATATVDDLKLSDAEGYSKDADPSEVTFSVNNTKLAKVDAADGKLTLIDDSTGVLTVTAVHSDKKVVATASIEVVNAPASVKLTASNSAAAGVEANVDIQLVDVDGKAVAAAFPGKVTDSKVVILSKPEGAIVDTDFDKDFDADIKDSGKSSFSINSNVEGTVSYQVIVAVEGIQEDVATTYYTGAGQISFGKASEIINGQNIIFMIGATSYIVDGKPIASTSVPFIENGRTYLGVRDMAYSMGITGEENVKWNNATQTATIIKDGITVEVTVGATAIKVTKNNVTTEVAIDAPAQNKDGRVYLPFRAVFEAFDYQVEYANGVITCM